jgi:hypothetical protein
VPENHAKRASRTDQLIQEINAAKARLRARLDRSEIAKRIAGEAVGLANVPVGVGRGAVHTLEGLGDIAAFGARMLNPTHVGPKLQAAQQLISAGKGALDTGVRVFRDPRIALQAAGEGLEKFNAAIVPSATPMASTFPAEIQRRAEIGRNLGELGFDAASVPYSGLAVKGIVKGRQAAKAVTAAEQAMVRTPAAKKWLAEPYTDPGHHNPARRYTKGTPEWFRNNPFFLYAPNVTRGQFNGLHYLVDPKYWGGGLPGPGPGWSGKKLGLEKFGLLDQVAVGMPGPRKAVAILNGAIVASPFEDAEEGHAQ